MWLTHHQVRGLFFSLFFGGTYAYKETTTTQQRD